MRTKDTPAKTGRRPNQRHRHGNRLQPQKDTQENLFVAVQDIVIDGFYSQTRMPKRTLLGPTN